MKVRIRFSKTGALVYIGHLDVMRYFQKLFRRANIPVAYSEGFSPHQILSFTPPLPLGMESMGEYADVELTDSVSTKAAIEALAAQSVPEINIMSFKEIPPECQNAMASVEAARYTVDCIDASIPVRELIEKFMAKDEAFITKKTKKSEKTINIRPLVYELKYDKQLNTMEMLISSGSTDNLKPEYVLEGLGITHNPQYDKDSLVIRRIDQYTQGPGGFVSLDDKGCDIL